MHTLYAMAISPLNSSTFWLSCQVAVYFPPAPLRIHTLTHAHTPALLSQHLNQAI